MSNMSEKWREYQNTGYFISNYGSMRKKLANGRWRYLTTDRCDRVGYTKVTLTIQGKPHIKLMHRLVAEVFIPNPNPSLLTQINHKDGNKQNNRVDNLEWVTPNQNQQHKCDFLHPKANKEVIRISKDWSEFILYPSLSSAAKANNIGCKEIRKSAQAFADGLGDKYSAGGFYWHFVARP